MLESLINPKRAERKPWQMFFIGLLYASLSVLLVSWVFSKDIILAPYSGIFIITFCVIFSIPFVYYTIKLEEKKDMEESGSMRLLKEHSKAIFALLWLFLGFLVAFSFWYMVLPNSGVNFKAQIETFCYINQPTSFDFCVEEHQLEAGDALGKMSLTASSMALKDRLFMIFANNIYVLIFTLVFSLIFGAGAIFILAWNASVIAAAVGIFAESNLQNIFTGISRYMIHGLPEIAAYFTAALAGGILSIAVIRHDTKSDKFWSIVQDSLNMIIIAVAILFIAAIIEVFITPVLF